MNGAPTNGERSPADAAVPDRKPVELSRVVSGDSSAGSAGSALDGSADSRSRAAVDVIACAADLLEAETWTDFAAPSPVSPGPPRGAAAGCIPFCARAAPDRALREIARAAAPLRRTPFQLHALHLLPVSLAKDQLLEALAAADGEPRGPGVADAASRLGAEWRASLHPRDNGGRPLRLAGGRWATRTRADFLGSVGRRDGKYCYTLGRMSFGLFTPNNIVLALTGCAVVVRPFSKRLRKSLAPPSAFCAAGGELKTYDIEVSLEVVDARGAGLSGFMTTFGFCTEHVKTDTKLPPDAAHRLDVCFVGGQLQPDPKCANEQWADIFGRAEAPQEKALATRMVLWLASRALGIELEPPEPQGVQRYVVNRPISGYLDVLYSDDDVRVTRGHRGSLVVLQRDAGDS
ncbi:hypothetical protein M885DRAFT_512857 [Pelagophyceae sp. CCMP2097]|nr:hypothetical protein M885DRAFT_512857 [Pelagophyceae sp. CCMP2097]